MIKFNVNCNEEYKIFAAREGMRIIAIGFGIIILCIVVIPAIFMMIFAENEKLAACGEFMLVCMSGGYLIIVIFAILVRFNRRMALALSKDMAFPVGFVIDENEIQVEYEKTFIYKNTNKIRKVIDKGEFYKIRFLVKRFYVQKNQIVKGSLEEFEKLFEGRLKK